MKNLVIPTLACFLSALDLGHRVVASAVAGRPYPPKIIIVSVLVVAGSLAGCVPAALPVPISPLTTRPTTDAASDRYGGNSPVATPSARPEGAETVVNLLAHPSPTLGTEPPAGAVTPAESTPPPGTEVLVAKAREMLTQMPGMEAVGDDIVLVTVEAMQWRDSSLGCPRQGVQYLQVITPGYLILLQAGDKLYEFHTDTGTAVVLCLIDGEDARKALQE
jgi:hypothetical protein